VPAGCLLRIADIERAAEAEAKTATGNPCGSSSTSGGTNATGCSGGDGVCSARLDAQSTCSLGRGEPLLTAAGVEALLAQWSSQLQVLEKRCPGADAFMRSTVTNNLRVMQAGPQLTLRGQAPPAAAAETGNEATSATAAQPPGQASSQLKDPN